MNPFNRVVMLPEDLDKKITSLTELDHEVLGVLLYKLSNPEVVCPEEILFLGEGGSSYVYSVKSKQDLLNEFFRVNKEYNYVLFHTHSKVCINKYSLEAINNFSITDKINFMLLSVYTPYLIELLITPFTKLVWPSCTKLEVCESRKPETGEFVRQSLGEMLL